MDTGYRRLVEMAQKSGMKGINEKYLSPAELEFAQRIIMECASMAHNNIDDEEDAARISQMIFDFFGVK